MDNPPKAGLLDDFSSESNDPDLEEIVAVINEQEETAILIETVLSEQGSTSGIGTPVDSGIFEFDNIVDNPEMYTNGTENQVEVVDDSSKKFSSENVDMQSPNSYDTSKVRDCYSKVEFESLKLEKPHNYKKTRNPIQN